MQDLTELSDDEFSEIYCRVVKDYEDYPSSDNRILWENVLDEHYRREQIVYSEQLTKLSDEEFREEFNYKSSIYNAYPAIDSEFRYNMVLEEHNRRTRSAENARLNRA